MVQPALISIDWGTTTLRCVLLADDGSIVARRKDGVGIVPPPPAGFAPILARETAEWRDRFGPLPIIMSGMIGSRQGWAETPYLQCPARARDFARNLFTLDEGDFGTISIVPGLAMMTEQLPPEVMRGEETQIIGAMADINPSASPADGLFVLPGTHSKWAHTSGGTILSFATYMTGEAFAALRNHTILGRLMPAVSPYDEQAFDRGVVAGSADGHPGALLNRIFATRTLGLFDRLAAESLESYLSGVLIGAELAAVTGGQSVVRRRSFTVIGSVTLSQRYLRAAQVLHLDGKQAPADCAAHGHWLIAQAANIVKVTPQ